MKWVAIDVTSTTGTDWLRIDAALRGHWHALISVCAQRENGGVFAGAREWSGRDLDRVAGLSRGSLGKLESLGLVAWEGNDLRVVGYDSELESKSQAASERASKAAKARHSRSARSNAQDDIEHSSEAVRVDAREDLEQCRSDQIRADHTQNQSVGQPVGSPTPPCSPEADLASSPVTPDDGAEDARAERRRIAREQQAAKRAAAEAAMAEYLEWFNRKLDRAFEGSETVLNLVGKHLANGRTQKEMRAVTALLRKKWADDPKMRVHLVPETCLRLEKFSGRLDEAKQEFPDQFRRAEGDPRPATPTAARSGGPAAAGSFLSVVVPGGKKP